jgi:hypothetical protein
MRTCPQGHAVSVAVARLVYPRSIDCEEDPGAFICWPCNSYSRGGDRWFPIDRARHEEEWELEREVEHEEEGGRRRRRKRKRRRG